MTERARRSWLVVSSLAPDQAAVQPDVLVIDLDAAVAPRLKDEARRAAPAALANAKAQGPEVFAAISLETSRVDLDAAVGPGLTGIVLRSPQSAQQVANVDRRLGVLEAERGLAPGSLELLLVLETAAANWNAASLIAASARVSAVALGRADLEMGLCVEPSGEIFLYPFLLQNLAVVARRRNVQAVGAWWRQNARGGAASPQETYEAALRGRLAGLSGGWCVRADQVDAVHRAYTPTEAEVALARRVQKAFDGARGPDASTLVIDGRVYDRAKQRSARATLALAEEAAARSRARGDVAPPAASAVVAPPSPEPYISPVASCSARVSRDVVAPVRPPVRRSALFVPITNERFLSRAWTRRADAIILDLEDSVSPDRKDDARALVRTAVQRAAKGGSEILVRINKELRAQDLEASVWPGVSAIVLPKCESAEDILIAERIVADLESRRGIPVGRTEFIPIIETPRGVLNSYEIGAASARVAMSLGGASSYDFSAEIGVEMFVGYDQYAYARGQRQLSMRAQGKGASDPPYVERRGGRVLDTDWASRVSRASRKVGIPLAYLLHPDLVPVFNAGFTPTAEELEAARKVLESFTVLEEQGEATCECNGQIIDRYEARRAEALLALAAAYAAHDRRKERAIARGQAEDKA
ncbi:MAG: citrate lyase subunit beta / citryl-CoA lyase [Gaiellaceae bacterium]|nr:citrate lyase subunit beta / citryl-CoA lyase [Gaiellaceae bacterium]